MDGWVEEYINKLIWMDRWKNSLVEGGVDGWKNILNVYKDG